MGQWRISFLLLLQSLLSFGALLSLLFHPWLLLDICCSLLWGVAHILDGVENIDHSLILYLNFFCVSVRRWLIMYVRDLAVKGWWLKGLGK